jgi:DNA-binding beta-propeller fold protein YncE
MNVLKIAARGSAPSGPQNPWDLAYASPRVPAAYAFDLSKIYFTGPTFVPTVGSGHTGIFFKPDGTKMFIVYNGGDAVSEYALSTAWVISSASLTTTFSVSGQSSDPRGLYFSPDGTRMYLIDVTNDEVEQYSLSTAWDISSASHVQSLSVTTQDNSPSGIFFKTDGTKMYVTGTSGDDVNEYDLSTAWDISTASYLQNFSVSSQDTAPRGIHFSDDGTKMYIAGNSGGDVNYYTLSSAWNISTASFVTNGAGGSSNAQDVYVSPDGKYLFTVEPDVVDRWAFADYFNFTAKDGQAEGLFFKSDGTAVYMCGNSSDSIHEYSLSTAWLISSATFVRSFSVTAKETAPFGLFFKPDGTEVYVIGPNSDSVHQYSLSTAWNISTMSFTRSFSVATQETFPEDIFFKDDGTKMYVVGSAGDDVNEYSLSTAWDISTASYVQNFSVASQETVPTGIFIGDSGSKMYITGETGDDVNEYTLSTPWNISTATFVQNFVSAGTNSSAIQFKSDGSLFFVLVSSTNDCVAYEIS